MSLQNFYSLPCISLLFFYYEHLLVLQLEKNISGTTDFLITICPWGGTVCAEVGGALPQCIFEVHAFRKSMLPSVLHRTVPQVLHKEGFNVQAARNASLRHWFVVFAMHSSGGKDRVHTFTGPQNPLFYNLCRTRFLLNIF